MRVLLVQCPCSFGVETPPLGLAYLSAFLKQNKIKVSVLDLSIALYHAVDDCYKQYWHSNKGFFWYLIDEYNTLPFLSENLYETYIDKILANPADVIGFSVQNTSALFTLEVIKRIKAKDASKKIILGGSNCYNYSGDDGDFKLQHDLHLYADTVVIGEGEETLLAVLQRMSAGKSITQCKGVAIPSKNGWRFTGFAEPIKKLDELPFPDFDVYQLNAYTDHNSLPIITSRGCIMRCAFCTDTYFWNPYRHRSAKNVFAEIRQFKGKYKNRFFSFNDSLINGNLYNFLKLCDKLIESEIGIGWGGNCRVDKRLTHELLKKFKDSGCDYLIVGIESGSNRILKLMNKGFTIEEAERFVRACHDLGVNIKANWIVGFPGETEDDFQATLDFIGRNRNHIKDNACSSLTINQFSYINRHRDELGIILDGPHLGLWRSRDGVNTIELRTSRLTRLEELFTRVSCDYRIIRQLTPE